jgi:tetratricopeptide (TPR) repeat protein
MLWVGILCVVLAGSAWADAGAKAHLGSGNQLMQDERFEEAAAQFEEALHGDPQLGEARKKLAICRFELRDYERAAELFRPMLPQREARYYLGRIDLVQNNLDSAIRGFRSLAGPEPFRDELYHLGVAYFKKQEFTAAARTLERAAGYNPRDSRIHQFLARTYQKLGRDRDADREFGETRRLKEYYTEGSVAISGCRALLKSGQSEKAWEECRRLADTDDVDKLVAIGMLFGSAQQYDKALIVWRRAVSLDPESPEINYNLALTLFYLKDLPGSRNYCAEAVRLYPNFVEASILYGTVLYMAGAPEALAVLSHAHELRPDDGNVRRLLAIELVKAAQKAAAAGDSARVARLLDRAGALDPGSVELTAKIAALRAQSRSAAAVPK